VTIEQRSILALNAQSPWADRSTENSMHRISRGRLRKSVLGKMNILLCTYTFQQSEVSPFSCPGMPRSELSTLYMRWDSWLVTNSTTPGNCSHRRHCDLCSVRGYNHSEYARESSEGSLETLRWSTTAIVSTANGHRRFTGLRRNPARPKPQRTIEMISFLSYTNHARQICYVSPFIPLLCFSMQSKILNNSNTQK
jgi:hypothetical protein